MTLLSNSVNLNARAHSSREWQVLLAALFVAAIIALFAAPAAPFLIDGVIYTDMARAMAENGAIHIADRAGVDAAPVLTKSHGGVYVNGDYGYPQYPSGYAFIAAPFFKLFGIHGLILMNALSAVASVWLTRRIALFLYSDERIAFYSILILGGATFFHSYAFAVWPHMSALALILTGVYLMLLGTQAQGEKQLLYMALAGSTLGFSLNFRIDGIVLFIAALFWLRLFSLPSNRMAALALIAGLAPHLVYAAYLNDLKFGVFSPFYYGPKEGGDSAVKYIWLAYAGGAAILASFIIDTGSQGARKVFAFILPRWQAAMIIVAILLMVAGEFFMRLMTGVYVLFVDIQALSEEHLAIGIVRDAHGFLSFGNYPKKALLQSLPFLPLLFLPIAQFFRGVDFKAISLSLMMIAAPIFFFSLNQFQGGPGHHVRYFLPCLPFISILTAFALREMQLRCEWNPRRLFHFILIGAISGFVIYKITPYAFAGYSTPLELYPQIFLSVVLLIALVLMFFGHSRFKDAVIVSALSGCALGYAGALSFDDTSSVLKLRYVKAQMDRYYENLFPTGSLVLTIGEDLLTRASENGVVVARIRREPSEMAITRQAIRSYLGAGRCVYIHSGYARKSFGVDDEFQFKVIPTPGLPPDKSDTSLYALQGQSEKCELHPK